MATIGKIRESAKHAARIDAIGRRNTRHVLPLTNCFDRFLTQHRHLQGYVIQLADIRSSLAFHRCIASS